MSSQLYIDDFIDLTSSQPFIPNNPPTALSSSIICIDSDDSFSSSPVVKRTLRRSNTNEQKNESKENQKSPLDQADRKQLKDNKISFGECPICWDQLGTRPLASTLCGHVFCIECIKTSLCAEKRCPMCRTILRGKLAYHPLYLPR